VTWRACLCALTAVLLAAPASHAKVLPEFAERSAAPGEHVLVDLGVDAERFLAATRVYLVPLDEAGTTKGQSDPHLTKVAEFSGGAVPRTFDVAVPRLPAGRYVGEFWFRGFRSDWYEMAGKGPRLTIREVSPGPGFDLADAVAVLVAALPW
jgi:hypothetical protein